MEVFLENNFLRVTVNSQGAEMTSIINKANGEEMLWSADPAVWNRHAPILFPHCGKLKDGHFYFKDVEYKGNQHGFARDMDFVFDGQSEGQCTFSLRANAVTMEKYPFVFCLKITYLLIGSTIKQEVNIENEGDWDMPFALGFHPGFKCPFDNKHSATDYEIRFDEPQTPTKIVTGATTGLVTGDEHIFFENKNCVPLSNSIFDNDSICLSKLTSKNVFLVEKDTGKSVRVGIEGFPYVLLWSAAGDMQFVCIEPWYGLPDKEDASCEWTQKPDMITLQNGQTKTISLEMTFDR